jgi:hypothetical protein
VKNGEIRISSHCVKPLNEQNKNSPKLKLSGRDSCKVRKVKKRVEERCKAVKGSD